MKFEDFLMQPSEEKHTKLQLQEQVERLQQELDGELQLNRVLHCAVRGPVGCCESCSCLSPLLPFKVQMLLAELAVVEEEIAWLEARINELKQDIYQQKHTREFQVLQLKGLPPLWERKQLRKLASRRPNQKQDNHCDTLSTSKSNDYSGDRIVRERRTSLGSSMELQSVASQGKHVETEEESGNSRCLKSSKVQNQPAMESEVINPNKLSEELIKCLIGIFLKLNQASFKSKETTNLTKHNLTCMNSGLVSKATFGCRSPVFPVNHNASHLDPYEILPEPDVTIRDIGPYKNFIQITRSALETSHLSECLPAMRRLTVLMQKLGKININYFTHKRKLAFWINVYNAAVMNVLQDI